MKFNSVKRLLAMLLVLCMVVPMLPASWFTQTKAAGTVPAYTESNSVKVIAGSDYQDANAADTVKSLLTAIKRDGYPTVDGFLFGGDYSASSNSSDSNVNELKNAVDSVYPGLGTSERAIYVQGNHDPDSMLSTTLSSFGAHDTGSYGVFVINEQNYMLYNNDEATVKSTAAALRSYLDQKLDQAYNKPIFVVSHLPRIILCAPKTMGMHSMLTIYSMF
jgi:hypothetical protein